MASTGDCSDQYLVNVRTLLHLFFSLMLKRLFLSPVWFLFVVMLSANVVYSSPSWLKTGAYLRYEDSSVALEWKCTGLIGKIAEINVSLYRGDTQVLTAVVFVDTESRGAFLQNGTYLGNTTLWLVASPMNDQIITLNDGESCKVLYTGSHMVTIQGRQKGYFAEGMSTGGFYDFDTGILIYQDLYRVDPALSKIGFPSISGYPIVATNIDLGPRELLPEIIMAMPYLLIAVAIVTVPAFVYWKRRQKRRQKATLAERRQKKTKLNSKPA